MISFDAVFPSLSLNHKLQASFLDVKKIEKRQFVFAEILSFLGVFRGKSRLLLFGNIAKQSLNRSEVSGLNRTIQRCHKKSRYEKRLFIIYVPSLCSFTLRLIGLLIIRIFSGMGMFVHLFELLRSKVRINLRCRQRLMAEQFLDASQIGAIV